MKQGDLIRQFPVLPGLNRLSFEKVAPVGKVTGAKMDEIRYFVDHIPALPNRDGVVYANRAEVRCPETGELSFWVGKGYQAVIDAEWCSWFSKRQGWSGGDGIYSFNVTDGNDRFDQKGKARNVFIFGDTFVGRNDNVTRRRYDPLVMVNNSMGIYERGKPFVHFAFNQTEKGSVTSFVKIAPELDVTGTIPQNLVIYDRGKPNDGWISGFNPKKVELRFDLVVPQPVDRIRIFNYYNPQSPSLASRGIRIFRLFSSLEGTDWADLGEYEVPMSRGPQDHFDLSIDVRARLFRFDVQVQPGIGNYEDEYREGVFALSRVEFRQGDFLYRDVLADANSVLLEESPHSYVWLQDGAVIGDQLYLFPYQVVSDHTQPEGMQFGILGIFQIRIPIVNGSPDFSRARQKRTPLVYEHDGSTFWYGGAVTANTVQAQAAEPDGYIYVYGYKTTGLLRQMVAARAKETDIELFDRWEYYDGAGWQKDPLRAAPLLDHISTEFSVSQILKGRNRGKWLAVFTHDTNTPYLACAVGETMVGPFDVSGIFYKAPEIDIFQSTTYCYNAKAHPQLSESDNVLVSYNTNTYSFDHNRANSDVYVPRFLRLKEV